MNTISRDPRIEPRLGDRLWSQRSPSDDWRPVRVTAVDAKAICFTYSTGRNLSTVCVARDRWRAYASTMKLVMPVSPRVRILDDRERPYYEHRLAA